MCISEPAVIWLGTIEILASVNREENTSVVLMQTISSNLVIWKKLSFYLRPTTTSSYLASVEWFGARHSIFEVAARPSLEQIIISNQFSTAAVFSRALWEKAQGYHDWGLGKDYVAEDWDLWLRMMALGARAINIPEALDAVPGP